MFRDFFDLRDELGLLGKVFSTETLALLSYPDLLRAAIGDAQEVACDLELVEVEQRKRTDPYLEIIAGRPETLTRLADELRGQGMLGAVSQRLSNEIQAGYTPFSDLRPLLRVYFRVLCLRSHVDSPVPRLESLIQEIDGVSGATPQEMTLLTIIRFGASDLLRQHQTEPVPIARMRLKTQGIENFLSGMSPEERTICLHKRVRDYSCTAGCFAPEVIEE
jgi:hypothetical protein